MESEKFNVIDTQVVRKMGFPDYYHTVSGLASALDANEIYNANRPAIVPGGDAFRQQLATMKELGVGAERGDTLLKEQRQNERNLTDLKMESSISFMKIIAIHKQDPSILFTMGLPLKDPLRNTSNLRSSIAGRCP